MSAHGARRALDPTVWQLRGEARPLIRRGALTAIPVGVLALLSLWLDLPACSGMAGGALLAGFVAFDAPARTRTIWQLVLAPVLGLAAGLGVLSSGPPILAIAVMTAFAIVGGCCVAVSLRLAIAGMMVVLGLLIAQGLMLDPDQALIASLATIGGVLVQAVLSLAAWAFWDREREQPGLPERLRGGRRALAANLGRGSSSLRHALRWGIALGASVAVYRLIDLQGHGYWVPLTVLFVLKPEADDTWERLAMRAIGTLAGLLLATLLDEALGGGAVPVALCLTVSAALAYALLSLEYALFTAAITVYIVLLTDTQGYDALSVADQRALATAIGIGIAALAVLVSQPTGRANAPIARASSARVAR
ncbi:MAG: FUSC family protein [Solirubrobacterales bacterium]